MSTAASSVENDLPPTKKARLYKDNVSFSCLHPKVGIVVPIMKDRFANNFLTYKEWSKAGFHVELVATVSDEESIKASLRESGPDMENFFQIHTYNPGLYSNAGKAKKAAYEIVRRYLGDPRFMYVLLLDDTVEDITNTRNNMSIMLNPSAFCQAVEIYAMESPVFGGTVAGERHRGRWYNEEREEADKVPVVIKGAFIQQAVVFSCKATPTLSKHFQVKDDYVRKMTALTYREVPFGEDIAFQLSLYEQGILQEKSSAQFRGMCVSRKKHKSATKGPFSELEDTSKEAQREMMVYLKSQDALKTKILTVSGSSREELTGIAVIPGGPKRIKVEGKKGERAWREVFQDTFSETYTTCTRTNM